MCHTDLHYREGGINDDFPFLLGHEAAGIVESVGRRCHRRRARRLRHPQLARGVRACRACQRGRPWYCFNTFNATQKMTLTDGTELSPALGIGAFAEKTLVAAGQCTKVDPAAPAGGRRAARLRRDGRARRGDQHRQRRPRRLGRGVRLRRRGRRRHRRRPAGRRDARSSPSTSTTEARTGPRSSARRTRSTPAEPTRSRTSKAVTDGNGADVCIEAVGNPEVYKQAFYARDLAGTVVLVGVPRPDMTLELPLSTSSGAAAR